MSTSSLQFAAFNTLDTPLLLSFAAEAMVHTRKQAAMQDEGDDGVAAEESEAEEEDDGLMGALSDRRGLISMDAD